jgi:UDP-glucose 4-epimerase
VSNLKRVLITGKNSYVGTNVEKWLMKEPDKYYVESISVRGEEWKTFDFSTFDVVLHVAGIAHVSSKKRLEELYFKVNRDLAIEVSKKAKVSGVKQFVFMSSMIVYSLNEKEITKSTFPNPDNFYGLSKLEAEKAIIKFHDNDFNVVVVRPPMIYGKNSKGNFDKLIKISTKIKVFPNYSNKKSFLYIDNLSIAIKNYIEKCDHGIKLISNFEHISTANFLRYYFEASNKKLFKINIFNWFIAFFKKNSFISKIFGDRYYKIEDLDIICENFIDTKTSLSEILE